jgi:HEAT repeat protein
MASRRLAAVEQQQVVFAAVARLSDKGDRLAKPVLADILAERLQLVRSHQREQLGGGVD